MVLKITISVHDPAKGIKVKGKYKSYCPTLTATAQIISVHHKHWFQIYSEDWNI